VHGTDFRLIYRGAITGNSSRDSAGTASTWALLAITPGLAGQCRSSPARRTGRVPAPTPNPPASCQSAEAMRQFATGRTLCGDFGRFLSGQLPKCREQRWIGSWSAPPPPRPPHWPDRVEPQPWELPILGHAGGSPGRARRSCAAHDATARARGATGSCAHRSAFCLSDSSTGTTRGCTSQGRHTAVWRVMVCR
jgi:hypothetical protein